MSWYPGKIVSRFFRKENGILKNQAINWAVVEAQRLIDAQPRDLRARAKIVYMSPDEFLRKTPRIDTHLSAAITQKEKDYDKGSLESIRRGIAQGKSIDIPSLDYSRMWYGWPSHEGRHRAFVAKEMGTKTIPVLVTYAQYRVYENNDILLETGDKEEAMGVWRESHRKNPYKFHEVHEFWDGKYHGICQFAPGDEVRW